MKQRNTVQRQIVLETVRKLRIHPTVEEVYGEIQKTHPTISKSTVYRNLRLLAESGEIRQVSIPGEQERYDWYTKKHYHFQCRVCSVISDIEVDIDCLDGVEASVQQKYGVEVDGREIIFRGICPKCKGLSAESKKGAPT